MRKKNGKRIGLVPIALMAVLALAAFISAGFWLVPNNSQTAEAQGSGGSPASKCVVTDNMILNPGDGTLNADRPRVSVAEHCFVSGSTATVEFTNSATGGEDVYHVYTDGRISGGTTVGVYLNGTETADLSSSTRASYYKVTVPAMELGSDEDGKATITVSGNGRAQISLHSYPQVEGGNPVVDTAPEDSVIDTMPTDLLNDTIVFTPAIGAPDAGKSEVVVNPDDTGMRAELKDDDDKAPVTATFKDTASAEFGMTWHDNTPGEGTIGISSGDGRLIVDPAMVGGLASFLAPGAVIKISHEDGYERTFTIAGGTAGRLAGMAGDSPSEAAPINADIEDVTVTATLSRNVEGMVTLTVGGGDDVMLKAGLSEGKSLTMTAKQARGGVEVEVVGLPEDENVRVEVSAEFSGDTGTLTEKGYAIRSNDVVDSVSAMTYSCKQDDHRADEMSYRDNLPMEHQIPRSDQDLRGRSRSGHQGVRSNRSVNLCARVNVRHHCHGQRLGRQSVDWRECYCQAECGPLQVCDFLGYRAYRQEWHGAHDIQDR